MNELAPDRFGGQRRQLLAAGLLGSLGWGGQAFAQAYPARPVRLIIPFPATGAADVIGRLLAQRLGDVLGQNFVADNRPGANTIIGAAAVAQASPDGYTLLLTGDQTVTINPYLYRSLPFDADRGLVPVSMIAQVKLILAVSAATPVTSISELIAHAKANPGLTYASSGLGSMQHLAMALFAQRAGLTLTHVPYRGGGPASQALLANEFNMLFGGATSLAQHAKAGRLRMLGVSSATRSATVPQVPTIAESGLPDYHVDTWTGLFAPGGTPEPLVAQLHAAVVKAMDTPEVKDAAARHGFELAVSNSPADFRKSIEADKAKWSAVIRMADVKLDS